jgi:hypothetical protein
MEWKTQDGRRPELERQQVALPEGYIGSILVPTYPTVEKTGTVYYQGTSSVALAESTAETGRVATAAPSGQAVASSNTSWSCVEVIDRTYLPEDEAKTFGAMQKADEGASKTAIRNVCNYIENAIVAKVLGSGVTPTATFDADKFILQVQAQLHTLRLYEGPRVLYGSTLVLKGIIRSMLVSNSMGAAFSRMISGVSPEVARGGFNLKMLLDALALWLGVDRVIAGRDANWNPTGYTGRVGLMVIDDTNDPLSHKYRAVYGKNFLFLPDGEQTFQVDTFYDKDVLLNKYTCRSWMNIVEFNSGMFKVWEGVTTE